MCTISVQVDELKEEIEARSQNSSVNVEHYEKQIEELNEEMKKVKKDLRTHEENAVRPSPEYLELQKQLLDIQVGSYLRFNLGILSATI